MKRRTTQYETFVRDDGVELELELPINAPQWEEPDVFLEKTAHHVVMGYLLHDDYCPNPLTDCDGGGELITDSEGVITDGNPWGHLGLEEEGERDFECDGVYELAVAKAKMRLVGDPDFLLYCDENFDRDDEEKIDDTLFMARCFDQIDFGRYGDCLPIWVDEIFENFQEEAWDELYSQGKIGTYLAVPVHYCYSVHGPGTTRIQVTSLDDANAVWVPSQCEIDNIKAQAWPAGVKIEWQGACGSTTDPLHAVVTYNGEVVFDTWKWGDAQAFVDKTYGTPKHQDLVTAAEKYAQGCLDEYEKWCNGDCYGCVVETFQRDGDGNWGQTQEDACWGFIGYDYAQETLKNEFFDPTVAGMKEGPLQ